MKHIQTFENFVNEGTTASSWSKAQLDKELKELSDGAADAGDIDKAEKSVNAKDKNKSSDLLLRAEIIRIFENLHQLLLCE